LAGVFAPAAQVEGAGSPRCNGVYRVSAEDAKSATLRTARLRRSLVAPTYHRAESEVGCFVRMKQYEIKSQQAFWWFIRCARASVVLSAQPGHRHGATSL